MKKDKNNFLINKDYTPLILEYEDAEAGQLFKAILRYADDHNDTTIFEDSKLASIYKVYTKYIERNDAIYEEKCKKNQDNIYKRWEKERNQKEQQKRSHTKEYEGIQPHTKEYEGIQPHTKEYEGIQSNTDMICNDVICNDVICNENDNENDVLATFEKIWEVYPLKEGKESASRAYVDRIREGWKPEQLLSAAIHYSEYTKKHKTEEKYIKRPRNFYGSDKTFADYIEEVKDVEYSDTGKNTIPDGFWA